MLSFTVSCFASEPTNHLDVLPGDHQSAFKPLYRNGIVRIHDRYFIKAICYPYPGFDGWFIYQLYQTNYDYYLERKEDVEAAFAARQMAEAGNNRTAGANGTQAQSVSAVSGVSSASSQAPMTASAAGSLADGKMDWKAQKEEQARLRKRQNELERWRTRSTRTGNKRQEIDELLSQEERIY